MRRPAVEIKYSQPVLYSHFQNRDAIVSAVALEGFRELAAALREAGGSGRRNALKNLAAAYLGFAQLHPALYAAMFILPTELRLPTSPTLRSGTFKTY